MKQNSKIKSLLSLTFITSLLFFFQNCSSNLEVENEDLLNIDVTSSCIFNGVVLQNGEFTEAYRSSTSANCTQERETRLCTDGILSGNYQYSSCSNDASSQSCLFNGVQIAHNSPVNAFLNSSVPAGSACQSQTRICNNGSLTGTYDFSNCTVNAPASCLFNGRTIAHAGQVRAFSSSSVASGQTCRDQVRTCSNGTLSGSYEFASCVVNAPRSCLFNGQTIPHLGRTTAFYASSEPTTCSSETRICNDGVLSGSFRFGSCSVNAPRSCLFNGQTIPHMGETTAFYAPLEPNTCASQRRVCNNGTLSGSFDFSTCRLLRSCTLDNLTINHGQSVTRYFSAVVNYTQQNPNLNCSSAGNAESRVCNDGALSGSARFNSCQVYSQGRVGPHFLNDGDIILLSGRSYLDVGRFLTNYANSGLSRSWDPTLKRCIFQAITYRFGVLRGSGVTISAATEADRCNSPMMFTPLRNVSYGTISGPAFDFNITANYVFPTTAPYRY